MKAQKKKSIVLAVFVYALAGLLAPSNLRAQWTWRTFPQTPPISQRNALNSLRTQVSWFRNATQNAPSFATGGYEMVLHEFQLVRDAYWAFKTTLAPGQLAVAANELAELEAGLDIIEEAFGHYQLDVAAGRPPNVALKSMCLALSKAAGVWLQELDRVATILRVF
jgi:hypothetical protein